VADDAIVVIGVAFTVLLASTPVWLALKALQRGVWNSRGIDVFRSERPLTFWFGITAYCAMAAVLFSFAIWIVLTSLRIQ
jgi:hypothetical protein